MAAIAAVVSVAAGVLAAPGSAATPAATPGAAGPSRIAPIVVRPMSDYAALPVVATDNVMHALYELVLVNTRQAPVTITKFEVRTVDPRLTIASFEGAALSTRLRRIDGSTPSDPTIAAGEQLFLFVDVSLFSAVELPLVLDHRLTIGDRQFNVAAVSVDAAEPTVLAPPVNGSNWFVADGCCGPQSLHRTTVYPTETGYSVAGRFAMDLRQMDAQGRFVVDDPSRLESYPSYGQYVNAVAGGRVVDVIDGQPDQIPGAVAPFGTFDEENSEGNVVVVELTPGHYAYYGQLAPGTILVKPGVFVRKGQPLAKIGNSGNSTAPHLHFELLSDPARIGADGLPFVLSSFGYSGRIDPAKLAALGPSGSFADSRLPVPQVRAQQLPLEYAIVDFESSSGSSGNPLL